MHMRFIFQSHDIYFIVTGTLKKSPFMDPGEHLLWDIQAIVVIFGTLDSFHKQEVINYST